MKSRPSCTSAADQRAKLELFVAHDAWVGGSPGLVLRGKIINDLLLEICRFIHQIIGNAQFMGDTPGIHDGLWTAAFVLGPIDAILRPELQGDAHHVITLLQQQSRCRGGINPTAHAHDHPSFLFVSHQAKTYGQAEVV